MAIQMRYDVPNAEFTTIIPDTVLDIIIENLWKTPQTRWIAEMLSDEQATAMAAEMEDKAAAAVIMSDCAARIAEYERRRYLLGEALGVN